MGLWWSSIPDALGLPARWSSVFRGDTDADRAAYRRSATRMGVQVAVVSAALVLSIVALVVVYVLWQLTPAQQQETHGPEDVHVYLDTVDLAIAIGVLSGAAILFAGVASWIIARRAVRPIAEALTMQRAFVADASHELRTPLTVLDARVQQLRAMIDTADPRRPVVDDVRDDTRVLVDIVNDLLEAARGAGEAVPTALGPELVAAERDMAVLAEQNRVRLRTTPTDAVVTVPATSLRRTIVALVDNAIAHSPAGGTVTVTAAVEDGFVSLRVRDEGAGIAGIAPRRVFERFAHGTPTGPPQDGRTRSGSGIGLALVRDVAVRHGGDVRVEHTGPHGTTFLLRLPVAGGRRRRH
ncbi:signal transduction histidine kinase [Curtobacterium pusillum]|uniref:histidine kinase n=1 Tax=Curtobacterium pusillum TaxID=69373 RepID=A0AAW3T152_9MICO|nr:HAMP domain-containing sensor histidine kinase [Curtobacterium pusillum]MBA8988895.1 signal transduction histidine kinase [Curtobacterium pusillum]